ncbi:HNH endonuclease [Dehalococcoidia bacterium]|nr:HNH endonuclease [Dehalococcoidia bacterium]
MSTTNGFYEVTPTLDNLFRGLVLFGRNVASYKFALAKSLIDVSSQKEDLVKLEDLAVPFSKYICEHLKLSNAQGTSASSRFLNACREFNNGDLTESDLNDITVQQGFRYVIEAFHVLGTEQIEKRFYFTRGRNGIKITDELRELSQLHQFGNLALETEARWNLVEKAWELNLPTQLLTVEVDINYELLTGKQHPRPTVTRVRDALNGYQKGHCFYCSESFLLPDVQVDHFIPRHLMEKGFIKQNLDGVWNLVLSCKDCNGPSGKGGHRIPAFNYLEKLHRRNEYFITSHHPLRPTLLETGLKRSHRVYFLNSIWNTAKSYGFHDFVPEIKTGIRL